MPKHVVANIVNNMSENDLYKKVEVKVFIAIETNDDDTASVFIEKVLKTIRQECNDKLVQVSQYH